MSKIMCASINVLTSPGITSLNVEASISWDGGETWTSVTKCQREFFTEREWFLLNAVTEAAKEIRNDIAANFAPAKEEH
jgi:hypothetical protein